MGRRLGKSSIFHAHCYPPLPSAFRAMIPRTLSQHPLRLTSCSTRDTSRRTTLAKLYELAKQKAKIEEEIVTHVSELAERYQQAKIEFEAVLKGRAEEMDEALGKLTELSHGEDAVNA
jgi:hypothetical protein